MEKTELKILCPFCNAPYTAEMEVKLFGGGGGCDSCGWGSESNAELIIKCENCEKVVYKKEYEGN